MSTFRFTLVAAALSAALVSTTRAHSEVSEASALSMLPVAVSVAAPSAILGAGAVLTVCDPCCGSGTASRQTRW